MILIVYIPLNLNIEYHLPQQCNNKESKFILLEDLIDTVEPLQTLFTDTASQPQTMQAFLLTLFSYYPAFTNVK